MLVTGEMSLVNDNNQSFVFVRKRWWKMRRATYAVKRIDATVQRADANARDAG